MRLLFSETLADGITLLGGKVVPTLQIVFKLAALIRRELLPLLVALLVTVSLVRRHAVPFVHAASHGVFLLGRKGLPFPKLLLHARPFFRRKAVEAGLRPALVLSEMDAAAPAG